MKGVKPKNFSHVKDSFIYFSDKEKVVYGGKVISSDAPNFKVTTGTESSNIAAVKVLEKVGFTRTKTEMGGPGFKSDQEVYRYKLIR